MKKIYYLFLFLFGCLHARGQTIDSATYDGSLYFGIDSTVFITLPDYKTGDTGTYPYFQGLITQFNITRLYRPAYYPGNTFLSNFYRMEFDNESGIGELIDSLENYGIVSFVEKIPLIKQDYIPMDAKFLKQWSLEAVSAQAAWDIHKDAGEIVIAIVDDAVLLTHEDLAANIWYNHDEIPGNAGDEDGNGYYNDMHGWNAGDNNADADYPAIIPAGDISNLAHGTHVAGIASAVSDNYKGISSLAGNAKIMVVRTVKDADAGKIQPKLYALEGLTYAVRSDHADIVNMSWGSIDNVGLYPNVKTAYQNIINEGAAKGMIFVAAAGNAGIVNSLNDPDSVIIPASLDNVISVANLTMENKRHPLSNTGIIANVDIAAPGEFILSCVPFSNNAYAEKSGTSMASPLVASACALIKAMNPAFTPTDVENCLKAGADKLEGVEPDYYTGLGAGRLNIEKALQCANSYFAGFSVVGDKVGCANAYTATFKAATYTNVTYNWDFDDGSGTISTTNSTISHNYLFAGHQEVTLTIKDLSNNVLSVYKSKEPVIVRNCTTINNPYSTHWMFGNKAGLDFSSGVPVRRMDNIFSFSSGSVTLSDNSGGLLFYGGSAISSGSKYSYYMADQNHDITPPPISGTTDPYPLKNNIGDYSPTIERMYQGGLIFDDPKNPGTYSYAIVPEYYDQNGVECGILLIRTDNAGYGNAGSSVDLIYPADNGPSSATNHSFQFTWQDNSTNPPTPYTVHTQSLSTMASINAVSTGEPDKYWIITLAKEDLGDPFYDHFHVLKADLDVGTTVLDYAKLEYIDSYYAGLFGANPMGDELITKIKISPDGNFIAAAVNDFDFAANNGQGDLVQAINIYTFNRDDGSIQFLKTINHGFEEFSFSPNSQLLYAVSADRDAIYQVNFLSDKATETAREVFRENAPYIVGLQLGPDGLLYVNRKAKQTLSAIIHPNSLIVLDSFQSPRIYVPDIVTLVDASNDPNNSGMDFPNIPDAIAYEDIDFDFYYMRSNCSAVTFFPKFSSSSYSWNFGNGNTSALRNPTEVYSANLVYNVSLTYTPPGGGSPVTINKTVDLSGSVVQPLLSVSRCNSDVGIKISIDNFFYENYYYEWYKDNTIIEGENDKYLFVSENGFYKVKVYHVRSGCSSTSNDMYLEKDMLHILSSTLNYTPYITNLSASPTQLPSFAPFYYSEFSWYRNGTEILAKDDCVCPVLSNLAYPGKYTLISDGLCGPDTAHIEIKEECIALPYDATFHSGGTAAGIMYNASQGYYVSANSTITIPMGASTIFSNTRLVMEPNSKIIVQEGAYLKLENVVISSCSDWQGIIVTANNMNFPRPGGVGAFIPGLNYGALEMINTFISDAKVAVYSDHGGLVSMDRCKLENNEVHFGFSPFTPDHYSTFNKVQFGRTRPVVSTHTLYTGAIGAYQHASFMDGVKNVQMQNSRYFFDRLNEFPYVPGNPERAMLHLKNSKSLLLFNDSSFNLDGYSIVVENGNQVSIHAGRFQPFLGPLIQPYLPAWQNTGVLCINSDAMDFIGGRYYQFGRAGIEFYQDMPTPALSKITTSKFSNSNAGIMISPTENPVTASFGANSSLNTINFKMTCNKFELSALGIVGSGNIIDQHASAAAPIRTTADAGNDFVNNLEWDLLWQDNTGPYFNYYHSPLYPVDATTPKPTYMLNGVSVLPSNVNYIPFISGLSIIANSCHGTLKTDPDMASAEEIKKGAYTMYPNPTSGRLLVDLKEEVDQLHVIIYSALGVRVLEKDYGKTGQAEIDLGTFTPGLYLVQISSGEKVLGNEKVIKKD